MDTQCDSNVLKLAPTEHKKKYMYVLIQKWEFLFSTAGLLDHLTNLT